MYWGITFGVISALLIEKKAAVHGDLHKEETVYQQSDSPGEDVHLGEYRQFDRIMMQMQI